MPTRRPHRRTGRKRGAPFGNTNALKHGLYSEYISAKEKTDGAIEDFFNNSAKATSAYLKEASEIPVDIVEAIDTESYRKRMRRNLRRASKFMRLFRM